MVVRINETRGRDVMGHSIAARPSCRGLREDAEEEEKEGGAAGQGQRHCAAIAVLRKHVSTPNSGHWLWKRIGSG